MLHLSETWAKPASLLAIGFGVGTTGTTNADAMARRCRALALNLTNRMDVALGRSELVQWLAAYHHLAVWSEPSPAVPPRRRSPLASVHLARWIDDAQEQVRWAIRCLRDPERAAGFALEVTLDDWVVPFDGATGERIWRPTDSRGRTLSERAVSLLTADYLARPSDYEHLARQCVSCSRIWFQPQSGLRPSLAPRSPESQGGADDALASGVIRERVDVRADAPHQCAVCRRRRRPAELDRLERTVSSIASSIAA